MPFVPTKAHALIAETVRGALVARGFDVLRADDRAYSEDLFRNIEAYIHGCRFAVAVFDRILEDRHNVNVAIETGYCLALRKPLCLLKEKTVKKLVKGGVKPDHGGGGKPDHPAAGRSS